MFRILKYEEKYLRAVEAVENNCFYPRSYYTLSLKKYKAWRRHVDKHWKLESRKILNDLSRNHQKSIEYERQGNFVKPRSFRRYTYKYKKEF